MRRQLSFYLLLLLVMATTGVRAQQLQGIGVRFGLTTNQKPTWPVVTAIVPNSPASRTPLKVGDWLLSVNDVSLGDKSLEEVAALIRGPEGSSVTLKFRGYGEAPKTCRLIRASYEVPDTNTTRVSGGKGPAKQAAAIHPSQTPAPGQWPSDFESACRQWASNTAASGFKKLKEYYTPFCYTSPILLDPHGATPLFIAVCVPASGAYEVTGSVRDYNGLEYALNKDQSFGGITSYICQFKSAGKGWIAVKPGIKDKEGHRCEKIYVAVFTK